MRQTYPDEEEAPAPGLKDEPTVSSRDSEGLKSHREPDGSVTSRRDPQSAGGPLPVPPEPKSYHTELVVVSLLLVLCLVAMAMGALTLWRQRRREIKTNPLVDPNPDPEVKAE